MQTKPWYQSKMVYLGLLEIAGAAVEAAMHQEATTLSIIFAAIGAATIALRAMTKTPVSLTKGSDKP
jgi:hypothetical protein